MLMMLKILPPPKQMVLGSLNVLRFCHLYTLVRVWSSEFSNCIYHLSKSEFWSLPGIIVTIL